ncbi:MAG: prepilin-type N-terminal cleavage/methylation domain-containing protein [Clostridiales Family XIII bacterium]|jgi:prepilin-type N-terminal cleavage/methylation domain-containing protein|nr:prepilin-type N-terminal cleavage/methylation domain-containing protein [Clostridiales Family XIII bacterium]
MARSAGVVIRRRKGFTLVEVIVVLVILAILAAIAIPALTGYIDKAEEKKYISDARNAVVAVRTVLDEAYADDAFSRFQVAGVAGSTYITSGTAMTTDSGNLKYFNLFEMSKAQTGSADEYLYFREASKLIGIPFDFSVNGPYWNMYLYAPTTPSYSVFDAPAFRYAYYPEGSGSGKPIIYVCHNLNGMYFESSGVLRMNKVTYNQNAGYTVLRSNQ